MTEKSPLSDEDLQRRTTQLLRAAESISMELVLQTERLAATIDVFNRDVLSPMREMQGGKHGHDREP